MQRLLSLKSSSPTTMFKGLLTDSELKARITETSVVSIRVDYFNCQDLVAAVNLLKKDNNSSKCEVVKKLPEENPQYNVYNVKPLSSRLSFIVSKKPTVHITLSLVDIVALIKEFDEHTKKNKSIVEGHAKKKSFIKSYFYLRRVNKVVHDEELIVAKATANLMQKVQEKLKKEIVLPEVPVQNKDVEIPLNFLRSGVRKLKEYIMQKLSRLFRKNTNIPQTRVKETDSNSYKN